MWWSGYRTWISLKCALRDFNNAGHRLRILHPYRNHQWCTQTSSKTAAQYINIQSKFNYASMATFVLAKIRISFSEYRNVRIFFYLNNINKPSSWEKSRKCQTLDSPHIVYRYLSGIYMSYFSVLRISFEWTQILPFRCSWSWDFPSKRLSVSSTTRYLIFLRWTFYISSFYVFLYFPVHSHLFCSSFMYLLKVGEVLCD